MNVYIFSYHTNNFKILWKSSDTIESVVPFFFWFVLRNIIQLLNIIQLMQFCSSSIFLSLKSQISHIQSIRSRPLSRHASKGRFKTRKSRDSANTTLTTNFFTWLEKKNMYALNNWNNHFILWFIAKWWKHVMRTQRRQLFFKS